MSYLDITGYGARSWRHAVATAADLPTTAAIGDVILTIDTGSLYNWDGAVWRVTGGASTMTQLIPETGGNASAAGEIGEIIESTQALTTTNIAASGAWGEVCSVVLTAGVWEIDATFFAAENTASELSDAISCAILDAADGTGVTNLDIAKYVSLTGFSDNISMTPPKKYVNISAGDTFYLISRFNYTGGVPQHGGRLVARRYR